MKKLILLIGIFALISAPVFADDACTAPTNEYFEYVQNAIEANWDPQTNEIGKITVEYRIKKNGEITGIQIQNKLEDEYSELEKQAVEAVRKTSPLKPYPDCIRSFMNEIRMTYTFEYNHEKAKIYNFDEVNKWRP